MISFISLEFITITINASWFWLYKFMFCLFFFFQKAENNRLKKMSLDQNFVIFFCFSLKQGRSGPQTNKLTWSLLSIRSSDDFHKVKSLVPGNETDMFDKTSSVMLSFLFYICKLFFCFFFFLIFCTRQLHKISECFLQPTKIQSKRRK